MFDLLLIAPLLAGASLCWRRRPRRMAGVFWCAGAAALLMAEMVAGAATALGLRPIPVLFVAAAGGAGLVGWCRWSHSSAVVSRWGRARRRKSGVASTLDIARVGSAVAMRRRATTVRPSLAQLSWKQRLREATTEVAVPLCRAGLLRVWASVEDVILVFGGPRMGKSGWLAGRILDAPGAVLVTSTRTDLYEMTAALRAEGGPEASPRPDLYDMTAALRAERGPVHVFNPTGLGGRKSTIGFNPVTGCEDALTAVERAEDMLPCGAGDTERDHWVGQARQAFAALLHAAALGGLPAQAIAEWIADPKASKDEVLGHLRRSSDKTGAFATSAAQFLGTNEKTQSSITASMRPALNWLANRHAVAATLGGTTLDVEELLRSRATVYLLGAHSAHTAPLLAALTGHIAREARRIAATRPGGRLDPPLTLALDEAALICPIPLDQWTSDMGGRGLTIIAAFQSRAQLVGRWGAAGAATILNNAAAKILFGGTSDRDDLMFWTTLLGQRDEEIVTTDRHGHVSGRSVRQVDVFSPAQLAGLPRFRVVLVRREMMPVVGRAQMAWERRDVRVHQHAQRAAVTEAERAAHVRLSPARLITTIADARRRRRTTAHVHNRTRRAQQRGRL